MLSNTRKQYCCNISNKTNNEENQSINHTWVLLFLCIEDSAFLGNISTFQSK